MDASFIEDDTVWEEPTPATEEPPAHAEPAPTEPEQVGWMEEKTDVEEHRAEAPAAAAE